MLSESLYNSLFAITNSPKLLNTKTHAVLFLGNAIHNKIKIKCYPTNTIEA